MFLPPLLQKISVIYYLRGLCPMDVPVRAEDFPPLALLTFNPDPVAAPVAVVGLVVLSIAVLAIAGLRVRRMEINYGTE